MEHLGVNMNFNFLKLRSIKSKVTLLTLLTFLISIWSLAFYSSQVLHKHLERQSGEQQFSAVSFMAAEINEQLETRLKSLEIIASQINSSTMANPSSLQALLEQRQLLQILFNGGVFVTDRNGIAIADVPLSAKRIGVNYIDRSSISNPLKDGKSMIGKPAIGKKLGAPIFSITVPIKDAQSNVIGVLAGTINLNQPSFLDKLMNSRYGETGGYLLVAPQYRIVVAATDKRRIMSTVSPTGSSKLIDRFMDGYEGSGILVNSLGVEVLASAKRVPLAGWYVAASLPVAEAFAPIYEMRQQVLIAASILTFFVGGLIWWVTTWILRRQLSPMLAASRTLDVMSDSNQTPQPLQIDTKQDEIGELISGFNRLLETLKQREEELSKSEAKFRLLFNNVPMSGVIWRLIHNGQQEIVDWELDEINQLGAADLKQNPVDLIGKRASVLFSDEIMNPYLELCREVIASNQPKQIETFFAITNKYYLTILFTIGTDRYANVSFDITERKLAEEALWNEKAFLRSLIDSATDLIYFKDSNSVYLGCNKTSELFTGLTEQEQIGKSDFDFFDKEIAELIVKHDKEVFKGGVAVRVEETVTTPNGSRLLLDTVKTPIIGQDGQPIGLVGISRDITERKKGEDEKRALEHQLHQAQKLESLGVLAGGIAHDFNNILTVIMGHCYLAKEDMIPEQEYKAAFQKIETAGNRAKDLCRQMLTYAGKSPMVQTRVNLWLLVDEVVKMLQAAIKKNVTIELDLKRDVPEINGDTGQIQQIIMNLVINASEAIGDNNGTIRIVLKKSLIEEEKTETDTFGSIIKAGRYACLEVTDTGCGMDEETQKRIFEPFYTTKFTGRGLGMSAISGIIKSHEGILQLTSTPGTGTTFRVYLPVPAIACDSGSVTMATDHSKNVSGTILLVEDEETLRVIEMTLLEGLGFSAISASNGSEALEIYREHGSEIDVILLDLIMPVMGGIEAYHELRKISPTVPIIICSGYGVESVEYVIKNDPHAGFVHKPYKPEELRYLLVRMVKGEGYAIATTERASGVE